MTPDERAPLEALADQLARNGTRAGVTTAQIPGGVFDAWVEKLRSVLASIPATTAPASAPTGLREALAETAENWSSSADAVRRYDAEMLGHLLDRFPAPVLPEDGVPLADGWHLKRMGEPRDDSWGVFGPNGPRRRRWRPPASEQPPPVEIDRIPSSPEWIEKGGRGPAETHDDDRPDPTTGEAIGCALISLVFGLLPIAAFILIVTRGL